MPDANNQPLPRTSLEPVCGALAEVIRRRRARAGLSLNQLAARTRLSRQVLSFTESQRRIPTIDTAARINFFAGRAARELNSVISGPPL